LSNSTRSHPSSSLPNVDVSYAAPHAHRIKLVKDHQIFEYK
jgi:hypothetical protein